MLKSLDTCSKAPSRYSSNFIKYHIGLDSEATARAVNQAGTAKAINYTPHKVELS